MFNKQLRVIFRVLGTALLTLANMPADADEHVEMTGKEYIDKLDAPDVGKDLPDNTTGTAAQVFDAEVVKVEIEPSVAAALEANAEAMIDAAIEVFTDPATFTMTDAAAGFTREEYHAQNWTDEMLVENGFMTITFPNVQPAAASTSPPAPSAPPPASIPAAPPAAPVDTAAQAPAGGATVDRTGLPWDARIHSGSRTMNQDGSWKKKKGVGETYFVQTVAELRQSAPTQAAPFQPLTATAAPAAPTAPTAPTAPAAGPTTFAELCKWITANGFTMAEGLEFAKPYGITAMGLLAQPANAVHIPAIHQALAALRA